MQFDQIKRREFISLLGAATAAWPVAGRGQQAGRIMLVSLNLNQLSALVCLAVVIPVVQ
jgi:hypothetical protein